MAKDTITLQLKWKHAFQFAGYYAAKEKGFYDTAGLDVNIVEATPDINVVQEVIKGNAQYGVGTSSLILERFAGLDVIAIAVIFQHSPQILLATNSSQIDTIQDIKGLRIMLEPHADEIIAYLKKESVNIEDLAFVQHSFDIKDLMSGHVDIMSAYSTNEPFFLEQANIPYSIFEPGNNGIDFYGDNLFTSADELSKNPDRVKAFRQASLQGWEYALRHPEEMIQIIRKEYGSDYSEAFLRFEAEEMIPLVQPDLVEMGYMNPSRWNHIKSVYSDLNMIPAELSLDGFLYEDENTHSLQKLYPYIALLILLLTVAAFFVFYVMRINRRLDQALFDSKQAQQQIWQEANLDPLTNLPNRRFFLEEIQRLTSDDTEQSNELYLFYLDLDHFKAVNDIHGHDQGDKLLIDVSQRINTCIGDNKAYRLGGDEFIVIVSNPVQMQAYEQFASKILQLLSKPYLLESETSYISASIGIAHYPNDAQDAKKLLKYADEAMYAAKDKGRNRYHKFTPEIHEGLLNRLNTVHDLRDAIAEQQFELEYQPIVDLHSNQVVKAEALIRWNHPTRGRIAPLDFIPIAEETGHIVDIGNWVFHTAVKQLQAWNNSLDTQLTLSINTSPIQYQYSRNTMNTWFEFLKSHDIAANAIIVEITENMIMGDDHHVAGKLLEFRDQGIQVAIDDFGTGYSSLSYLNKFDIDFIKIDKSFIDRIETNAYERALCEAIIMMAHKLGLDVIAEGIETQQQCDILKDIGCDFGQGYLFSKPLSVKAFEDFMKPTRQ